MVNAWHRLPLSMRLIALFLGLAAGGYGLEQWAQAQRPQLPGWGGPEGADGLMTSHPTRLWGMASGVKPNAEGSQASINALGFRGPMPEQPKPDGRYRIITLGDSSFYGFGVNDAETFDVQLTAALQDEGRDVDSVNAGVAGYSIAQHRVAMDEVLWDLEPDLLVLCNVWSDNTWDTFHDEDLLVSAKFARQNPLTRSAFVKLVAAWWGEVSGSESGKIIVWNGAEGWPEGKVRRVPLPRWIAMHHALLEEASERGVGVVFLQPTNSFLLSERPMGPPPAWTPYFDAMNALGQFHNVPVVDVTAAYTAAMADGVAATDLLWDKMHPTALGHSVLAAAIRATLNDNGWPYNPSIPTGGTLPDLGIDDVPNPQWTDDAGAGSPQVKLFELTPEEQQAMDDARKAMEARGPPEPDAVQPRNAGAPGSGAALAPADGRAVDGLDSPSPGGTWSTAIEISGGTPPYAVKLLDAEGRIVGSARVKNAASFRLKVRRDIAEVTVVATDAAGREAKQGSSPDAPAVSLVLGG